MKTNSTDIADFYRQISLLLKSGLPLPESINQLGRNFSKSDFKETLFRVSDDTSKGETLANAMRSHPYYFTDFHIRMIEAGEESGMLPETLSEIARTSHLNLQLTSMVREIAIYPVFAIGFAFSIVFALMFFIIPGFKSIFEDMLEGEPLPFLTDIMVKIGDFCVQHQEFCIGGIIAYIIFFLWLFSGSIGAKKVFLKVISIFPGAGAIFYNLTMARVASMWATLMKQKISAVESLNIIADLLDSLRISSALKRISESANLGTPLVESIEKEKIISSMIPLTIEHVPEKELPDELVNLATLYRERASTATRKAGILWGIILVCLLASTVGTIVISMFLPLICIIQKLGGG